MRAAVDDFQICARDGVEERRAGLAYAAAHLRHALPAGNRRCFLVALRRRALPRRLIEGERIPRRNLIAVDGLAGQVDVRVAVGIAGGFRRVGGNAPELAHNLRFCHVRQHRVRLQTQGRGVIAHVQHARERLIDAVGIQIRAADVAVEGELLRRRVKGLHRRVHGRAGHIRRDILRDFSHGIAVVGDLRLKRHGALLHRANRRDALAQRRPPRTAQGGCVPAPSGIGNRCHLAHVAVERHVVTRDVVGVRIRHHMQVHAGIVHAALPQGAFGVRAGHSANVDAVNRHAGENAVGVDQRDRLIEIRDSLRVIPDDAAVDERQRRQAGQLHAQHLRRGKQQQPRRARQRNQHDKQPQEGAAALFVPLARFACRFPLRRGWTLARGCAACFGRGAPARFLFYQPL